jgi:putative membrane-bound dehydrogenase-like protein
MALDDRGRVWVAEAYEYPVRAPEGNGRDRILIFEDADGDGQFDKRKVFAEHLNLVSGIEVGFGGVWVGAAPYFMFIPDRNGDDVPDGEPEILLDGWAMQDTHETLNTFIWGPDGWLYGCHGVFTHSRVGKPGTPDSDRIPLNAAIWRYHPTRHEFEIFAEGTSNPWGVDFDDHGQAFCTACVIPHLYHIIQGARYQRQAGSHFNPYTYGDIRTIADHLHYLGDSSHARNGSSGAAGGGHAHSGAMIYLGGTWPEEYRGRIFMNNIHGQRLNTDILKREGSGYVGSHGPDFLLSGDIASQILNIRYGPDGNAYFIDWYDTNACHHNTVEGHDRSNGRVYKVSHGDKKAKAVDLKQQDDLRLAEMVLEKNDWYVRHSRRILQERATAGKLAPQARKRLAEIAVKDDDATRRLRAMWALHVTGGVPAILTSTLLGDASEHVRAWSIQLAFDGAKPNFAELLPQLAALAENDRSPVVRLYLASALQRIPHNERWEILEQLTRHAEDADDHNLPLMYWYAAEPLAEADPKRALAFALSCGKTIPLLRAFLLRRLGSADSPATLELLVGALGESGEADEQRAILQGIDRGLTGRRRVEPPKAWPVVYRKLADHDDVGLRHEATALGVKFGDSAAMTAFRELLSSQQADTDERRQALKALLAAKDPGLAATLLDLLQVRELRREAITGLALYDNAQTSAKLLTLYESLPAEEKRATLATLGSRAPYAVEFLKAVAAKEIPITDLSADLVRQLHNLHDQSVDKLLAETWGQVRPTAEDKARLIAEHRQLLTRTEGDDHDLALGRAIFAKTCQQCHTLYGVGEKIGPDLTGSNRSDAEYLLSNVFDPSGLIAKEYQSSVIVTVDGRVVTGLITAEDDKSLTIRTPTETLVLPKDEVEERTLSDVSVMPDDQLKQFTKEETLALFAYLRDDQQAPMLATKENAAQLFNGRDLTGWTGDSQLWSVEDGEIIGRTEGLSHNTFLISDLAVEDFRLSFDVKLVDNAGNSGVQFRSQPMDGFEEVRGYQADIGAGWWGKLYEENGRALLWDKSGEEHVKPGEWNHYEIEAIGSRVRTWINGQPCVDLDDPDGARRGIIAVQLHSGGKTEVRFRDMQLEVR